MMLAGVHHITIAPALLKALAETEVESLGVKSLWDEETRFGEEVKFVSYLGREKEYRIAFTRSGNGEGERKLGQVCVEGDGLG